MTSTRLLFVDNYDSFTYNVVHLLSSAGASVDVVYSDAAALEPSLAAEYRGLVIGPGPGNPSEQARMMSFLRTSIDASRPILGVCLGLQAIGEACGARVVHAPSQMHGKVSSIEHDGVGLFAGIPSPFQATRYHSLCLDEPSLPPELRVTARSSDRVVQGIAHATKPIVAVQFHPESVLSEHGPQIARNFLDMLA